MLCTPTRMTTKHLWTKELYRVLHLRTRPHPKQRNRRLYFRGNVHQRKCKSDKQSRGWLYRSRYIQSSWTGLGQNLRRSVGARLYALRYALCQSRVGCLSEKQRIQTRYHPRRMPRLLHSAGLLWGPSRISGHVVAVIDGNYYDTWDSGDKIPIYYWYKANQNWIFPVCCTRTGRIKRDRGV